MLHATNSKKILGVQWIKKIFPIFILKKNFFMPKGSEKKFRMLEATNKISQKNFGGPRDEKNFSNFYFQWNGKRGMTNKKMTMLEHM